MGIVFALIPAIALLLVLIIVKSNTIIKNKKTSIKVTFVIKKDDVKIEELKKGKFVNFFIPKYKNKDFLGWYDNDKFDGKPITYFMAYDSDVAFYAKWGEQSIHKSHKGKAD